MTDYIIEHHKHGWLVKAGPEAIWVPCEALEDVAKLAPPDAVLDGALAACTGAIFAVGSASELKLWRDEIEAYLESTEPHPGRRWLKGTRIGTSSLTIFTALIGTQSELYQEAIQHTWASLVPSIPTDRYDFARCQSLLDITPEWGARLSEVAETFPLSGWPKIAAAWPRLKALFLADKWKELDEELRACRMDAP